MTKDYRNYIGVATDNTYALRRLSGGILNFFDIALERTSGTFSATGGNQNPIDGLQPGNGYRYHIFTTPGNFVASASGVVDVLIVAGGGGAGNPLSSGGGAGGIVRNQQLYLTQQSYPIVIGSGGAGSSASTPASGPNGFKGSQTTAFSMIAEGGGGGGPYDGTVPNSPDINGGCGGGGRNFVSPFAGGTGTQPTFNPAYVGQFGFSQYGYPGASAPTIQDPFGLGGGGAGGPGIYPYPAGGQSGGNGQPFPDFNTTQIGNVIPSPSLPEIGSLGVFGGGGAAGGRTTTSLGGPGGGGDCPGTWIGQNGFANTGGGGGGGLYSPPGATPNPLTPPSASGGSGVVIVRYVG